MSDDNVGTVEHCCSSTTTTTNIRDIAVEDTPLVMNSEVEQHNTTEEDFIPVCFCNSWSHSFTSNFFLFLSCLAALCQDANDIAVPLTILQPFFWLGFAIFTYAERTRLVIGWLLVIIARAIPAMDYFFYDTTRMVAYATALVVIFLVYLFIGGAILVQVLWWRHHLQASSFVFATLLTALFQVLFRASPIGGAGNPAMNLGRVIGLRQVASLGGEISLVFGMAWTASLAAEILLLRKMPRRILYTWAAVTSVLLVYGWARENVGLGLYLRGINRWPLAQAPVLQVSCLTRSLDSNRETMIARTQERMVAGDDIIMWSETAVLEPVAWDDFDWSRAPNPGTVIAATFFDNTSVVKNEKVYNSVAIWNAQGLVSEYSKNRPVPVVEYNVSRGEHLPTVVGLELTPLDPVSGKRKSVYRKFAMSICFDLDFDYLSRHAHQADLMIGPSWYWASIGSTMWHHNSFRAIENGFHLVKCSERGISGHLDAHGRVMNAIPTLENDIHVMEVPLTEGIKTVYSSFGFIFGWICVGLAPLLLGYIWWHVRQL